MIGISALVAFALFWILIHLAAVVAESYCLDHDIYMTEFDWMEVDRWIFGVGAVIAVCVFSAMFLSLLHDRMAYIRTITQSIEILRAGQKTVVLPLEGKDELTQLAQTINEMSETQQKIRLREKELAQEKDQLIRALSHDIRTPLTSILAYSEYLGMQAQVDEADRMAYVALIRRKTQQIRELTYILLDGSKRNPEYFENARLLMEQLAAEFEEELENDFRVRMDLSGCGAFGGSFDVQELRRVFDNLCSNVSKYADPAQPVELTVSLHNGHLQIRQSNAVRQTQAQSESFRIGLRSMQRIAQYYAGQVAVQNDGQRFSVEITLCEF